MYSSLLLSLTLEQCQNYSKCDERKISFVKLGDKAFLRLRVKFFVKYLAFEIWAMMRKFCVLRGAYGQLQDCVI